MPLSDLPILTSENTTANSDRLEKFEPHATALLTRSARMLYAAEHCQTVSVAEAIRV